MRFEQRGELALAHLEAVEVAAQPLGIAGAVGREARGQPAFVVEQRDARLAAGTLMLTFEWSDWRCGWWWWIQSVYVVPEQRRRGVYRALYDHVLALARAEPDVCGIRLYVERDNLPALRTYEALGMDDSGYRLLEVEL